MNLNWKLFYLLCLNVLLIFFIYLSFKKFIKYYKLFGKGSNVEKNLKIIN